MSTETITVITAIFPVFGINGLVFRQNAFALPVMSSAPGPHPGDFLDIAHGLRCQKVTHLF